MQNILSEGNRKIQCVKNESENVQCSYQIQYTVFGMMYIFSLAAAVLSSGLKMGSKSSRNGPKMTPNLPKMTSMSSKSLPDPSSS